MRGGAPGRGPTSKHAFQAPNVLVAHLEEGIEAIHLYSGRTLCKLHLPPPGLHADLNGDGVLDHVQACAAPPLHGMPCAAMPYGPLGRPSVLQSRACRPLAIGS